MRDTMSSSMGGLSVLEDSAVHRFPLFASTTAPVMRGGSQGTRVALSRDAVTADSVEQDLHPQVCNTSGPQNLQTEHHRFPCQQHFTHIRRRKKSLSPGFAHIIRKKLRRTCWSKGFSTRAMLRRLKGWTSTIFVNKKKLKGNPIRSRKAYPMLPLVILSLSFTLTGGKRRCSGPGAAGTSLSALPGGKCC